MNFRKAARTVSRLICGQGIAVFLLTLPYVVQAQFDFTTNADNSITITKYTGPGGAVIIPSMTNGLQVTGIGDWAFSYFYVSGITSVTIPDSVTSIGSHAFYYADVTGVAIGTNVTSIGDLAFAYCSSLTNITVPV